MPALARGGLALVGGGRASVGMLVLRALFFFELAAGSQILYQPSRSSTFVAHRELPFTVQYADANSIEAITCVDYVQLGEYKARVPFACFLKATTPMLKDVDGVAGFGIPKLGAHGEALPMPLLWALTDPENVESNTQALQRRFMFFSAKDSAELQLGGYDPKSIKGEMRHIKSLSPGEFMVGVTSLKVGLTPESAVETLVFKEQETVREKKWISDGMLPQKAKAYVPAVLDTGTSCLILPSNDHGGKLADAPFKLFVDNFVSAEESQGESLWSAARSRSVDHDHNFDKAMRGGTNVYLEIGGTQYKLPYQSLLIKGTNKPCVRGSPPLQQSSIILGDVFFHTYAVEFDMRLNTRSHPSTIGLAEINPDYKIIPKGSPIIPITLEGQPLVRMHVHKELDKLPIDNEKGLKYFVQVTIGTPPQLFKLAFDTGSSTLGVFVAQPTMNDVLLEEIGVGGTPLRVRPIPYMVPGASREEHGAGGSNEMRGEPTELMQVNGEGGADNQRHWISGHWGARTVLQGVALCGGLVIFSIVVAVRGRRSRRR